MDREVNEEQHEGIDINFDDIEISEQQEVVQQKEEVKVIISAALKATKQTVMDDDFDYDDD